MSIKHRLEKSIYHLLKHNRDGAFETQHARKTILKQIAGELIKGNYKLPKIDGLKQKHIVYLNQQWLERKLSNATIKNRNSHLRWLCEKLNKPNMMPTNDQLGIGKRQYAQNKNNKAVELAKIALDKITDKHVLVQIHLQRYLGLRREECIKLKPHKADKGDHLELQASWCKGGRARTVPILSKEARYWLDQAKQLVDHPNQSLVPDNKNYIQHRRVYDKQTRGAGIQHAHGLRHAYAQERYRQLTGWDCPRCGGLSSKQLTPRQKLLDRKVRLKISQELGHCREAIVSNYCGK